ncbi:MULTISPECIES: flagellar biosynthetic protein FliO [Marinomonas]|uniref:flagellar biosynthetic protein FliO n=1 Tax=Marinomonas TaxID=28253 RepID=UPI001FB856E9|nr:flagellar biosynthetic protein FliO [Marinomonas sp. KMM3893]
MKTCLKTSVTLITAMLSMAVSYVHAAVPQEMPTTYSIWKVVLSLAFIVVFIPACLWLVKKLQVTQMRFGQSDIRVVSSQSLGAKEKIVLIEVEGEKILLGVTSQSINHLKSFSTNGKAFAQVMTEAESSSQLDDADKGAVS